MHDNKTKQREINGLLDAMTAYHLKEGLILTEDESDSLLIEDKKINMMPVWLWLLKCNTFSITQLLKLQLIHLQIAPLDPIF